MGISKVAWLAGAPDPVDGLVQCADSQRGEWIYGWLQQMPPSMYQDSRGYAP